MTIVPCEVLFKGVQFQQREFAAQNKGVSKVGRESVVIGAIYEG